MADLVAFLDVLHLKAAVVGDGSSGGFVVRRFAIDHPERALGLVLIGSPLTLRDKLGVLGLRDSTVSKLTGPIDPGFVRQFQQSTLAQLATRAFLETLVQENLKVPVLVWRATFEGLLEDDSSRELSKIRVPSSSVVYPGAGHAFHSEDPHRQRRYKWLPEQDSNLQPCG